MGIAASEGVTVLLRALIYSGTVLVAGGVLFRVSFPALTGIARALRWQIVAGAALLIICEPLRYLLFLLQISDGDLALALSPSMRWIGMETPLGQASLVRLGAMAVILALGLRWRAIALLAAAAMIASYLVQGHTVTSDGRGILAALLFAHLVAVHWWIGSLPMLLAATAVAPGAALAHAVERFGAYALWIVGALVIAGGILLGMLTGWHLDLARAYQQAFAIKLGGVALILVIAAINKLRITPALAQMPDAARASLRRLLAIEMLVALMILSATALATLSSPLAPRPDP